MDASQSSVDTRPAKKASAKLEEQSSSDEERRSHTGTAATDEKLACDSELKAASIAKFYPLTYTADFANVSYDVDRISEDAGK